MTLKFRIWEIREEIVSNTKIFFFLIRVWLYMAEQSRVLKCIPHHFNWILSIKETSLATPWIGHDVKWKTWISLRLKVRCILFPCYFAVGWWTCLSFSTADDKEFLVRPFDSSCVSFFLFFFFSIPMESKILRFEISKRCNRERHLVRFVVKNFAQVDHNFS